MGAHQDFAQAMHAQAIHEHMAEAARQAENEAAAMPPRQPAGAAAGQPRPPAQAPQLPHLLTSLGRYLATLNGNLAAVPIVLPSRSQPHREHSSCTVTLGQAHRAPTP